jgi:hypothetical protein
MREIFIGNASLLICSLLYLAWWVVTFKPGCSGMRNGAYYLAGAFITGIAAIILMSAGINALSSQSSGTPVRYIIIAGTVLYAVLFIITNKTFHRRTTSELIIIIIWAVIEVCAITVLNGTGRLSSGQTLLLSVLAGLATVVGLICYVAYYRLNALASYLIGMIPLITDVAVMVVVLGVMAWKG